MRLVWKKRWRRCSMGKMTGNEFLVKALQEEGVEKIFGYPGACVIDIFD